MAWGCVCRCMRAPAALGSRYRSAKPSDISEEQTRGPSDCEANDAKRAPTVAVEDGRVAEAEVKPNESGILGDAFAGPSRSARRKLEATAALDDQAIDCRPGASGGLSCDLDTRPQTVTRGSNFLALAPQRIGIEDDSALECALPVAAADNACSRLMPPEADLASSTAEIPDTPAPNKSFGRQMPRNFSDGSIRSRESPSLFEVQLSREPIQSQEDNVTEYEARVRLTELLRRYNARERPVERDGNSQFRALAEHLHGTEDCHQQVRREVCAHMRAMRTRYESSIRGDLEDYLARMHFVGTAGDDTTCQAAADCFGLGINILSANEFGLLKVRPQEPSTSDVVWMTLSAKSVYCLAEVRRLSRENILSKSLSASAPFPGFGEDRRSARGKMPRAPQERRRSRSKSSRDGETSDGLDDSANVGAVACGRSPSIQPEEKRQGAEPPRTHAAGYRCLACGTRMPTSEEAADHCRGKKHKSSAGVANSPASRVASSPRSHSMNDGSASANSVATASKSPARRSARSGDFDVSSRRTDHVKSTTHGWDIRFDDDVGWQPSRTKSTPDCNGLDKHGDGPASGQMGHSASRQSGRSWDIRHDDVANGPPNRSNSSPDGSGLNIRLDVRNGDLGNTPAHTSQPSTSTGKPNAARGQPTIVRQASSKSSSGQTVVRGEDGDETVFGEQTVRSLLKTAANESDKFVASLTHLQLQGLLQEVEQRLVSSFQRAEKECKDKCFADDRLHYEYFGLSGMVTDRDLDLAYKKMARQMHPDKNGGTDRAKEKFQELNDKYESYKALRKARVASMMMDLESTKYDTCDRSSLEQSLWKMLSQLRALERGRFSFRT